MNELLRFALIGFIIFMAHMLEGITGFGCTVIALPFLTLLLGIKMTVPVLCILGVLMAAFIVFRSWRSIQWKEFLFIAGCAVIGLPVGIFIFQKMPETGLCLLLACFMIGVGLHGTAKTWKARKSAGTPAKPKKSVWMGFILFCGGVIHGAFGTGGPFVVIYASKALPEKSLFRVTLSLLWLTLNATRLVYWTGWDRANLSPAVGKCTLYVLPFMVAGTLIGDYLHHKVNDVTFRLCVYCVLAVAGFVMLGNNLLKLAA